jgi:cell shape-determining protein MreD
VLGSGVGVILIAAYYLKVPWLATASKELLDWAVILSAFALMVASVSLVRKHLLSIVSKDKTAPHSVLLLVIFSAMAITGIAQGTNAASFKFLYDSVLSPIAASMMGSIVFYFVSAAYRTFRAKSLEATLLLVACILVMLGRSTIGTAMWPGASGAADWLLGGPNTAANRGIIIGAALGLVSAGARLILGIDRSYLGE